MKQQPRSSYPFRMATMMAPSRIIRTMSPPAQIPRIRPISSECCDTSRGRLLSLQAAARGQGQVGGVGAQGCCEHPPLSTPGGIGNIRHENTGISPTGGLLLHEHTLFHQDATGLCSATLRPQTIPSSQFQWGETVPLCTFHHTPHKIIHPWIQHPAPPLQTSTIVTALRRKIQPREKPQMPKQVGNKSVGWGWNNPSHAAQPPPVLVPTQQSSHGARA